MSTQYNDVVLTTDEMNIKLIFDDGLYDKAIGMKKFLHTHRYYELFYVVNSNLCVVFPDKTVKVEKDEILIIPPQTMHTTIADDEELVRCCISFIIEKSDLSHSTDISLLSIFDSLKVISMTAYPESEFAFARLKKYSMLYCSEKKHLMSACFHEILYLLKLAYRDALCQSGVNYDTTSNTEEDVHIIDLYINTNFAKEPSLSEIARLLHKSKRQTSRLISKIYGRPFKDQIIFLKMQNAARLLSETELTAENIARIVGYKSVHGFYTEFEKSFGITPIDHRKQTAFIYSEQE